MRHRLLLSFAAEAEQKSADDVVAALLRSVPFPGLRPPWAAAIAWPPDFIPPQVRARLKDLRLTARRAVGVQGIGLHHSRSRGAGLEFAQYRAYEPGDELRQVDWKLYARSDRFFVREAERESPLAVWLLLDATASMAQADAARPGLVATGRGARAWPPAWPNWPCARATASAWSRCSGDGMRMLAPAARPAPARSLPAGTACAVGAAAHGRRPTQLRPLWERIGAGDLVVLLSDWLRRRRGRRWPSAWRPRGARCSASRS